MDKDELRKYWIERRNRQTACRISMEVLRNQWRRDQAELLEVSEEYLKAGYQVNMEINEP